MRGEGGKSESQGRVGGAALQKYGHSARHTQPSGVYEVVAERDAWIGGTPLIFSPIPHPPDLGAQSRVVGGERESSGREERGE